MDQQEKEQLIDDILSRNVVEIYPEKEEFKKALLSGKKLRLYNGMDATGPELHLGHSTILILLEKFRRLGHEVILLFGDFTSLIGDPTDKSAARVMLTEEQVNENLKNWKEQAGKILNFEDKDNPALIKRNSQWLGKLTFKDLIGIASNFTVQQMLERDMFEKRIKEEKPVYLHEFFYPLMQGYDSVAMDVDLEIGATDQTFNMLAGRTLQKAINKRDKFVLTTNLLQDPDTGKKLMSKSEGDFIALDAEPKDMFGKVMSLGDGTIGQLFRYCTYIPLDHVEELEKGMKDDSINPRDAKLELAYEITKLYHGEKEAEEAKQFFVSTFSKKEIPDDVSEVAVSEGTKLIDFIVSCEGISKSDARRKIEQGAVSVDGEKLLDGNMETDKSFNGKVFKVGKKGFYKLALK